MNIHEKIINIIKEEFQFLINDYNFIIESEEIIGRKPYFVFVLSLNNSVVRIDIKYFYFERIFGVYFMPIKFTHYKNDKEKLKEIITESLVYNFMFLLEIKEPLLGIKYKNFQSVDNESELSEKLSIVKVGFDKYALEILNGNYDSFIEINNYINSREQKKENIKSSYGYLKNGELVITENYDQYLLYEQKEKKKKLNDIYIKICDDIEKEDD